MLFAISIIPTITIDRRNAYLSTVDPRARIAAAVILSAATVAARRWESVGAILAVAVAALTVCGLPFSVAAKRLLTLNLLLLPLCLLLPLTTPGAAFCRLGSGEFSREGVRLAALIVLKGNAVLLTFTALLGAMDPVALGHALHHLRVPDKLAHLLLFTVRYLDVLHREYLRLRAAMKARGFRPRLDRHTYRSLGYLAGMLLVRGFDRAERIAAAMKCRGFKGRFFMLEHFAFGWRDVVFCAASTILLLWMFWMEYA